MEALEGVFSGLRGQELPESTRSLIQGNIGKLTDVVSSVLAEEPTADDPLYKSFVGML